MGHISFDFSRTFEGQLPLRENCDLLDPRQALLPAFTGFALKGAPMMLPVEFFEALSEHIIEYLGVPVDKNANGKRRLIEPIGESQGWEPRRKYVAPQTVMNRHAAAGKWVTPDTEEPKRETVKEVLDRMSHTDQVQVADAVLDRMGITRDEQAPPSYVFVKDLRKYLGLSHAQTKLLLSGWGFSTVTPMTKVSRDKAMSIIAHYRRTMAQPEEEVS